MTISKVNPAGWGANTILTSTQISQLDVNVATRALDKSGGDQLTGAVNFGTGGQIIANTNGGAANGFTGCITATTANAIQSGAANGITSQVSGGIQSNFSNGILAGVNHGIAGNVAGGIYASVAGGINTNIAGGIDSGVAGGINLSGGALDWPTFPARTRTIVYPCHDVAGIGALSTGPLTTASLGNGPGFSNGFVQASVANPSYLLESGTMKPNVIITSSPGYIYYMPLHGLHHGSTISSASLYFIPTSSHAALPAQQPAYMIWRVSKDYTSASAPLLTALYVQNAAASSVAYANVLQTLTFAPNQNAVIDTANYLYYAYIYDECGLSAVVGNRFISIGITYGSITSLQFP